MREKEQQPLGGLIAGLVLFGILILLGVLLLMGALLGWFRKEEPVKKPVLSSESILLEEGEKFVIEISNYRELQEPSVKWAVEDREVATVKNNKDGTAEISARSAGEAVVTVKAEGCEEVQCRVVVKKPPIASIAGTAWETEDGAYYFLGDGDYYYFISEKTENYIKGSTQLREMSREEMEASEAARLVDSVNRAAYFRLEASVDLEVYYGNRRNGGEYVIYIAANETEAAIYDSGWNEAVPAQKTELLQADALDLRFPGGADVPEEVAVADASAEGSSGYSFTSAGFSAEGTFKESLNVVQIGSELIFKRGDQEHNALYRMPTDGSREAELFYQPQDGQIVTVFGTDGQQLIFGLGDPADGAYGTAALYRMSMNGGAPVLLTEDRVSDFCISDGYIYYTDYSRLVKLSMSGSSEVLWDYGVYCYEISDDLIFLFDGDAWELLDAETGEDFGYICEGCNYDYECDFAELAGDYLYYVAYEYATEQITLRALNIWDGKETVIGSAYDGSPHDTYCVQFYGNHALFTAGDGEDLIRIDLADGTEEQIYLEDAGYWYTNEIILVDGRPVLYLIDDDANGWYAAMDDSMQLTTIVGGY